MWGTHLLRFDQRSELEECGVRVLAVAWGGVEAHHLSESGLEDEADGVATLENDRSHCTRGVSGCMGERVREVLVMHVCVDACA